MSLPHEAERATEPLVRRLLWKPFNLLQAIATGVWTAGLITVALAVSAPPDRPHREGRGGTPAGGLEPRLVPRGDPDA